MNLEHLSKITLAFILMISIIMGMQLPKVQFDYDFERFFPTNDPETLFFRQFTQEFGNDNDYFLIGLKEESGIFQKNFLQKVRQLTNELETHPDVLTVHSPTNLREPIRDRYSSNIIERPWIRVDKEALYAIDSSRIYQSDLVGYLFSDDRKSISIYVRHTDQMTNECCGNLVPFIKARVEAHDFNEVHYAGKCFGQTHFIALIQRETFLFINASILLVIIFLWFSFRAAWGIYLPIAVVGLTVLWTVGLMTMMGKSLDIISNIIPTILLIIGIANVVHLLTHYLIEIRKGRCKIDALRYTVATVGKATLLTTFTTTIGFLSLTTSSFISLAELGIFASVGLLIALLLTYTLLPSALILHPDLVNREKSYEDFWEKYLVNAHRRVMANPRIVIISSALFLLLGIIGASQIQMNNFLLDDLKKNDPQRVDFSFFADHFGGARTFDCVVEVKGKERTLFEPEILKELAQVDRYLENNYGISNLISPSVLIAKANRIYNFGKERFEKIPDKEEGIRRLENKMNRLKGKIELNRFIDEKKQKARIRGYIPDWGSKLIREKDEAFFQYLQTEFPNSALSYHITGSPFLMDLNNRYLAQNVLAGLIFALGLIAIIFAFLFKSARLVLITLVPNVLPLLFVAGVMGFAGIDLKISTSIIFIIAFGIAVDDSIHFLSRFRKEWQVKPLDEAIKASYLTTGKAIVVTSFILIGGFLTLCLSSFKGTFYIGALVAMTLAVALIADLTILPVLLKLLLKDNTKEPKLFSSEKENEVV